MPTAFLAALRLGTAALSVCFTCVFLCRLQEKLNQPYGRETMFQAVSTRDLQAVRHALEDGLDIDIVDETGNTPLQYSALIGDTAMVSLLLDNGAQIDRQTTLGMTALMTACANNQAKVVRLLLARGANPHLSARLPAKNALQFAEGNGARDAADALREHLGLVAAPDDGPSRCTVGATCYLIARALAPCVPLAGNYPAGCLRASGEELNDDEPTGRAP